MRQIYILEDNEDIAYILELLLANEGFSVEVFSNVEAIWKKIAEALLDLFLLDIMLPDGNGLVLCQDIKNDPLMRHVPVVMMSAHMSPGRIVPEVQIDGFIAKPFDLEQVTDTVKALV